MKRLIFITSLLFVFISTAHFQSIESKIREFAKNEYPNDQKMQDYVYNKQMSAYKYMLNVTDQEFKRIAIREYFNDYSMQKYIYDKLVYR